MRKIATAAGRKYHANTERETVVKGFITNTKDLCKDVTSLYSFCPKGISCRPRK